MKGLKRISSARATHPGHSVFNFLAGNYINELVPNKNYKYIKKGIYAEKAAYLLTTYTPKRKFKNELN